MKNIKKESRKFIKILNCELNFQNIKQYFEKQGFKVLFYGQDVSVNDVMSALDANVPEYEKSISYNEGNCKYIFIKDILDDFARLEALFHESGHIFLEHKTSMLRDEVQECEANEFSLCLLKAKQKTNRHNKIAISYVFCILILTMLLALTWYNNRPSQSNIFTHASDTYSVPNIVEPAVSATSESDIVYVTKNGECYHKPDCYYIRNSDVVKLTISDATDSYRACKICIK